MNEHSDQEPVVVPYAAPRRRQRSPTLYGFWVVTIVFLQWSFWGVAIVNLANRATYLAGIAVLFAGFCLLAGLAYRGASATERCEVFRIWFLFGILDSVLVGINLWFLHRSG